MHVHAAWTSTLGNGNGNGHGKVVAFKPCLPTSMDYKESPVLLADKTQADWQQLQPSRPVVRWLEKNTFRTRSSESYLVESSDRKGGQGVVTTERHAFNKTHNKSLDPKSAPPQRAEKGGGDGPHNGGLPLSPTRTLKRDVVDMRATNDMKTSIDVDVDIDPCIFEEPGAQWGAEFRLKSKCLAYHSAYDSATQYKSFDGRVEQKKESKIRETSRRNVQSMKPRRH